MIIVAENKVQTVLLLW